MKRFALVATVVWSLTMGLIGSANASLIEQDLLVGSGDKYITFDTNTGLSWLDLTFTAGWSVENIINSNLIGSGFRYANTSEIDQLVADMGGGGHGSLPSGFLLEMGKLGITQQMSSPIQVFQRVQGMYWNNRIIQMASIEASIRYDGTNTQDYYGDTLNWSYNSSMPTMGNFLVREVAPVPEPSTMLLLSGGIAGLAFWRKRKKTV